ncbi:WYL domain-containing protein [Actinotalea sp. K2]|uniref:helix-turn-helix transcriptional regulator n=1 Tax=Actinotalea sp. K2 TaxID=2939438 RepID=UPI002017FF0A|nr:WYL domain-containing protein [Actinotalea sp. K2]MCL3861159.1 WYL domain-containing protein [Actinotalea sp. K2]
MRADRLVATLLLLQSRGRATAAEVAAATEVSVPTARRDLEALSAAGVPVYPQPGRGGGWSLVGGARTDLTGLTAPEARALFLLLGPTAAASDEVRTALRKLVQALPPTFRTEAETAAHAVVVDRARWGTFRVDRVVAAEVTDEPARRPEGFVLEAAWEQVVDEVEERRSRTWATVLVDTRDVHVLRDQFGRHCVPESQAEDGRTRVRVGAPTALDVARHLAGWGAQVDVVDGQDVRAELARMGAELVARQEAQ